MYIRTSSLKGEAGTSRESWSSIGNLGQPASLKNKFDNCTDTQKRTIQTAFLNALRSVNNAAAVLGTVYGRPDRITPTTRYLLNRHFHTTDRGNLREILRMVFRIGRALQNGLNFECMGYCGGGLQWCGYAQATQWFGGRGPVHICFDNRPGMACTFATLNAQEQAALIIHEAAHRHVGIADKAYLWENPTNSSRDYSKLTSKQAMDNADSYAWFSVMLLPGL